MIRDDEIWRSHSAGNKLPPTGTWPIDFYTSNEMIAKSMSELKSFVYKAIKAGQRVIQFKLFRNGNEDATSDKVLNAVSAQCGRLLNGFSIEMRYNDALWVFEIEIK